MNPLEKGQLPRAQKHEEQVKRLGARLASARRDAGLNQGEVGEKMGVPKETVSRWERGAHDPGFTHVLALATLYGVSLDWLAERSGHETGLTPGRTVFDRQAIERIEQVALDGGSLRDLAELILPPAAHYAWDVPDRPLVLGFREARKLYSEVDGLLAKIKEVRP